MPRVVPSQVVTFINTLWPAAHQQKELNRTQAGQLSGLVDLVDQIPEELLIMDSALYAPFICAKAHIKQRMLTWAGNTQTGHELGVMPGQPEQVPVTVIRSALAQCPDESPTRATSELNFVADAELRTNLRNDMGAINRALSNSEWKAATVLAGSTIEAFLLWALQRRQAAQPADITTAIAALRANGTLTQNPSPNLESWNLQQFIEVAANLGIITAETATQTRLAKNFRNLIHPGRAQRLGQKYDRGTALSAVAGVEHVVRDLT